MANKFEVVAFLDARVLEMAPIVFDEYDSAEEYVYLMQERYPEVDYEIESRTLH